MATPRPRPTTLPASCANRPDGGYTGPAAPALTNNRQAETDYVFDVKKGKYYGHPNPARCEYVLNAGNPAGYTGNPLFKVNAYPAGQQADPNYDLASVYDAGLHASANGTIEYQNASAFGGALEGKLLVVALQRQPGDRDLRRARRRQPLRRHRRHHRLHRVPRSRWTSSQDATTGNLYVSRADRQPANTAHQAAQAAWRRSRVGRAEATAAPGLHRGHGRRGQRAAERRSSSNTGGAPVTVTGATITGADAALVRPRPAPSRPTIPAGGSATFPVTFNPTAAGPRGAALTLTTDSPASPTIADHAARPRHPRPGRLERAVAAVDPRHPPDPGERR